MSVNGTQDLFRFLGMSFPSLSLSLPVAYPCPGHCGFVVLWLPTGDGKTFHFQWFSFATGDAIAGFDAIALSMA